MASRSLSCTESPLPTCLGQNEVMPHLRVVLAKGNGVCRVVWADYDSSPMGLRALLGRSPPVLQTKGAL